MVGIGSSSQTYIPTILYSNMIAVDSEYDRMQLHCPTPVQQRFTSST